MPSQNSLSEKAGSLAAGLKILHFLGSLLEPHSERFYKVHILGALLSEAEKPPLGETLLPLELILHHSLGHYFEFVCNKPKSDKISRNIADSFSCDA